MVLLYIFITSQGFFGLYKRNIDLEKGKNIVGYYEGRICKSDLILIS